MKLPTIEQLENALQMAENLHNEYELVYRDGQFNETWSGFYAAYILGKLGEFVKPSILADLIESTPDGKNWFHTTAEYILKDLRSSPAPSSDN